MITDQLTVVEPGRIEVDKKDIDENIEPWEVLVETEYSIISAGTEGAGFTGLVKEMPFGDGGQYPRGTGYGNLGRVLKVGGQVVDVQPDDRVLSFSGHSTIVKADARRMVMPVPDDAPGEKLVFTRMAGVSISALRSSSVQPGDAVLVVGGGLVGNFAAQLFGLAGADVMLADLSDLRLQQAAACGIGRTVNSGRDDLVAVVMEWTGGGVRVGVEAIGISEVIAQVVECTARYGETILLGSPRARAIFDVTPMLLRVHLEAIRMIGALEWRWPQHATERSRDLDANYRQIAEWIVAGRLVVDPLLTHIASPADCQAMYDGLTSNKEEFLGVVFDWSKL